MLITYILAKNESENIGKCLDRLRVLEITTVVLDSGSTDDTASIVRNKSNAILEPYKYTNHADAYNWILGTRTPAGEWAMVLDSDMEITQELWSELKMLIEQDKYDAIRTPILMYSEGVPLPFGSLCPPKAILFRGGSPIFEGCGHGERLLETVKITTTKEMLIHNDKKSYSQYLMTQLRYADNLCARASDGKQTWRDRIRTRVPILAFAVPVYSYFFKFGFRSGRAGGVYALDRMIAELLQYRQAVISRMNRSKESGE